MGDEKEKIIDFLIEANKLKDIKRTGWVKYGIKKPESVADHIYSTALMAMTLSRKLKVNSKKLLELILIHDLCEVYSGDIAVSRSGKMYVLGKNGKIKRFFGDKKAVEEKSMKKILMKLPKHLRNQYYRLWLEFENKKTKEAKIAHELDKLDYIIQTIAYKRQKKKEMFGF